MARVFLHIGEPKTGTTFLQQVLWGNRAELAASALQGMGGALGAVGVSLRDAFGECVAEPGDTALQLPNEAGQQVVAAARPLDEPHLFNQFAVY